MQWEAMRSMTAWSLLASFHQEPVPSQVTAAGSCAQVTRPGTMPRGTPSGKSGGSNRDPRKVLVAASDRANCRRVSSISVIPSIYGSRVPSVTESGARRIVIVLQWIGAVGADAMDSGLNGDHYCQHRCAACFLRERI